MPGHRRGRGGKEGERGEGRKLEEYRRSGEEQRGEGEHRKGEAGGKRWRSEEVTRGRSGDDSRPDTCYPYKNLTGLAVCGDL